ncbi:UNVERIFIED_CONTAM: Potassium channel SKOR [Sesamum radiatum]|uniref:Potassium channel n=1 Tax=Sesamum radiatum TaxID=300843 RepID=A0AAW2V6C1_SESRA
MNRSSRERDDESEADEELKVEDPQHSPKSSSWKNMYPFKSFRNYYTRQESFSISRIGSGRVLSHGCIIHPENWWYVAWTHFILIWAVYSSFFTPLEFAFFRGLPKKFFLLDIAGQFAFLIDIFLCFFVGYRDPHSYCLVHNPNLIAIRYLKSRFLVDLIGCLPWDAIYKATRVHEEFFLPGEVIIEGGSIGDQLYFLCDGKLDEVRSPEDSNSKESLPSIQTHSSIGEISVICNIPEPRTVHATELSKLLRIDKQALVEVIEIYLSDGRTIINNLLEGRESDVRNKILESAIALQIEKHESELAMRLNCAANDGDLNRIQHLVESGADPNKMDYNGQSALHRAASKGYEDIIQFLVHKQVQINPRDHFGRTPLFKAIKNGHDRAASLLVRAGASLSIDDAGNCLCNAVAKKDLDFLKRLLANGINPNSKNYDLRTPLHLAASEGLYSESILLLEAGASVFATDRWGRTPIDEARIGGNRDLLKLLEDAKVTQMSEFSCCYERSQGDCGIFLVEQLTRRKCTVFPGFPWDHRDGRSLGVVLWVPETIEQLIKMAKEQLSFHGSSCLLSENGGKILDVSIILDDQKLFLASDELHMST